MNTQTNAVPETNFDSQVSAPAVLSATRPFYWSVRRELWENRSIYIAPLAAAALAMLGFLVSLIHLSRNMLMLTTLDPAQQLIMLAMPYSHVAWMIVLTSVLVGIFYSLDALYSERRDRSILFWKSLPVSDLITVLSKASIPLVILPLLVSVIILASQWIMLLLTSAVLMFSGVGAVSFLSQLPLFQMQLGMLYGVAVLTLWWAPIYAWLMLISGWVRRAAFLWAVLPLLAISAVEKIAFHTSFFGSLLLSRLIGFAPNAFAFKTPSGAPIDPHFIPLTQLTPGRFLSSPGLWVGLVVAVAFLAAAVRLRHYREPL
jgi:ABC-2 type transport system permease protein